MIPFFLRCLAATAPVAATFFCASVFGAAHVPSDDNLILERLPPAARAVDSLFRSRAQGTATVTAQQAVAEARKFVEIGQLFSDPRAYGYAQAALGPWWSASPAPDEVLLMRARILQFRHQFSEALRLLEAALQHDQFDPDAWLMLASIEQVRGNVPASRAACLKLIPISDPLIGAACVTGTASLTAEAKQADPLLDRALRQPTAASPSELAWAWTILAELRARTAMRDDEFAQAEVAFKSALATEPESVYARSAYADFLIDRGRSHEVRAVLGEATQADALLLRSAIAARIDADSDAGSLRDNLEQRFADARQRGDETHLREQARFELHVRGDSAQALSLASRNFQTQREPADAQLLVDAAMAAKNPEAARPVVQWLDETGIDEPRLRVAVKSLESPSAK